MSPVVSTSLAQGAVLAQVGPRTGLSLVAKGSSRKVGAGLETLGEMTKREVARMSSGGKRMSAGGKRVGWGGKQGGWGGKLSGPTGQCPRCPKSKPIQDLATCKCFVQGSDAARHQGICNDRKVTRNGKTSLVHYVAARVGDKVRCLIAGGQTARAVLGHEGCPPGKFLAPVKRSVPLRPGSSRRKTVTVQQCVRPQGKYKSYKDCPSTQVLVKMPGDGGNRCIMPETAAQHPEYKFIRRGTLPPRHRVREGTSPLAVSLGT